MRKTLLCALGLAMLLSSCGGEFDSSKKKDDPLAEESPEVGELKATSSFLSTPRNYVKFGRLETGVTKSKKLRFTAPSRGRFTLESGAPIGFGIGCQGSGEKTVSVRYTVFQRDGASGAFSAAPRKRDTHGFVTGFDHDYELERGDEIELTIYLTPNQYCRSGQVGVMAIFH